MVGSAVILCTSDFPFVIELCPKGPKHINKTHNKEYLLWAIWIPRVFLFFKVHEIMAPTLSLESPATSVTVTREFPNVTSPVHETPWRRLQIIKAQDRGRLCLV